jgi:hypothetical protein
MKPSKVLIAVLLAGVVFLAGCGGSDNSSSAPATTAATKPPSAQDIINQLTAAELTCSGVTPASDRQLGTREDVSCELRGESINIVTFNTNTARDQFLTVAREFGGIYVVGDLWAVGVPNEGLGMSVRKATGGVMK